MFPGNYPLYLYRGDTYSWLHTLFHDQHRRFPVNLTGASAKAEIRDAPSGRLRVQMDCQVQLPNKIIVVLSAMQSEDLLIAAGVWDLQVTQISTVTTIVRGAVTVEADVTDSRIIDRSTSTAAQPFLLAPVTRPLLLEASIEDRRARLAPLNLPHYTPSHRERTRA